MKALDIQGQVYGSLTVIERADSIIVSNQKRTTWKCRCVCGNGSIVTTLNLRSGNTTSCGCMKGRHQKENDFYREDDYMIGTTTKGERFLFDADDYDIVKLYYWYADKDGYIRSKQRGTNEDISMHRLVLGLYDDNVFAEHLTVDHIYHNTSDNRKKHLRLATKQDNNRNVGVQKNNTSGVTGVTYDKRRKKWVAQITVDYKNKLLGRFDSKDDAIKAREKAEKQYFGEFAYKRRR